MATDVGRPLQEAVGVFESLADGTRLRLLFLLAAGEANVTALCARTGLAQPTVSHHLGLLRMAGLVLAERRGKQVFYTLVTPPPAPGALRVSRDGFTITVTPTADRGHH
jgi:ArsR family transcriptional regulator